MEGRNFFTNPGGKGGNQAVAAAKLGIDIRIEGSIRQAASGIPGRLRSGLHLYDGKRLKQHGSSRHNRCEGDNRIILSSGANHE